MLHLMIIPNTWKMSQSGLVYDNSISDIHLEFPEKPWLIEGLIYLFIIFLARLSSST